MKYFFPYCAVMAFLLAGVSNSYAQTICCETCDFCIQTPDSLIVSDAQALYDSLPTPEINERVINRSLLPKIFSGYHPIATMPNFSKRPLKFHYAIYSTPVEIAEVYTEGDTIDVEFVTHEIIEKDTLPCLRPYHTPAWLNNAIHTSNFQADILYRYMIEHPEKIEVAYWDLPKPPVLVVDDQSFWAFLKRQVAPEAGAKDAMIEEVKIDKRYWLHKFNTALQFSQAYVSPNWYQGGNNYLSLLFNFNWNVQLNQAYHPHWLLQSDLTYKLAMSSNPKGSYHKYTIAEDNFQYNFNLGLKAVKNWYYSFNLLFKTQLFNNYEESSSVRTASFLSPGDLNMGLGMTYSRQNKLKTFQLTLAISPLSYNLKTCIAPDNVISHALYNIDPDKRAKSEIGSNVELNMNWQITTNISYKTRVFMFTDYKYFLGDWQNTLNFEINKFLSTQLFLHLRYDGSSESYANWKKFMMREILSFGLSYTFSTKP